MQYVLAHTHTLGVYALSSLLATVGIYSSLKRPNRMAIPLIAAAGILVAQASLFWTLTVDDAFITYRFARNWAEGLGPVYQAGERVEGFTSFAWTALLAGVSRLGGDLELAGHVLGLISACLVLPAIALSIRRWQPEGRAACLAPILLALDPLFASWACAGMEAPLFAATLAWASWAFLSKPRGFPLDAVLFGLLVWVRPEGMLFAGLAWMMTLLRRDQSGRLRWTMALVLVIVPFWVGRWVYYGDLLPNTFYAKTGFGSSRLMIGWHSLADFAGQTGVGMIFAVLLAILLVPRREPEERFIPLAIAGFFTYVVWAGGDILHLRFYVHTLPLWTALAAVGVVRVIEALESVAGLATRRWAFVAGIGLVLATVTFQATERALRSQDQFGPDYVVNNGGHIQRSHRPLGRWLREHAAPGSVVAAFDIGGLGYESGLPIVDLHGLTDRRLARLLHSRASGEMLSAEVRSRDPDFLVLYGSSRGPVLGWLSAGRDWIARDFRMHSAWNDSELDKGMVLMVRKGMEIEHAPMGASGVHTPLR